MRSANRAFDIVCLSHLRWGFVWQRPQHLLSRCAQQRRVFFVEEPVIGDELRLEVSTADGVTVVVPHLPLALTPEEETAVQRELLAELLERHDVRDYVLWFYTPM